jgi:uncharacterized protein YabN with tetrapyrrole methylase and pyrophosphatase domain
METYHQMVDRTLECLRINSTVCAAYYGHPGFFVYPSHRAVELARAEGHRATMVPGVSSLDCLLCDLGIDPSKGCQIFEATDMILRRRKLDTSSHVVILQVSALGEASYSAEGYDRRHLPSLASYLSEYYPSDFMVKAYHASHFPIADSMVKEIPIGKLNESKSEVTSTLYIPPLRSTPIHLEVLEELNLTCLLEGIRLVPLNMDAEMLLNK